MSQELYELPEGWGWKSLTDVTRIGVERGFIPEVSDGKTPFVGMSNIDQSTGLDSEYELRNFESVRRGYTKFQKNAVLLAKITPCTENNKTALIRNVNGGYATTEVYPIHSLSETFPYYLLQFLRSPSIRALLVSKMEGATGRQRVPTDAVSSLKIPLPPLNEQKRIVAKLDALFTRIDTAITHLQQTLELSKALFASALDSALVPTGNIDALPESWSCEVLQTVSNLVSDGTHHSPKEQFHDKQDGLYKYITSKNIKFDGLKLDNVTYIRKEVHDEIYARCNPEYLDQLITKDGAKTGTCCLNMLDEAFSLLSSVALVKLKRELMLPHFLNYFLQSPTGQELMIGDISGAAITRTNLKKLKAMKVPLAPMKEQQRIVSHLDFFSERTRTLEASTQEKISDLTALKASLLDAAFKGQL